MDFSYPVASDTMAFCSGSFLRKFQCPQCLKVLSSKQNFREHSYIHTGEKPFRCTEPGCVERFRQGSQLSVHRKMHRQVELLHTRTLIQVPKVVSSQLTDLLSFERQRKGAKLVRKSQTFAVETLPELSGKQEMKIEHASRSFCLE